MADGIRDGVGPGLPAARRRAGTPRVRAQPRVALARASEELSTSSGGRFLTGAALSDLGRTSDAGDVLDPLVGAEPDVAARRALARERAWVIFRRGDGAEKALHALEEAETETGDPVVSSLARGEMALLLTYLGRFADVGTIGIGLAAPEMDDRVRLRALPAAGAYLAMTGQFARATELCDQLEPAAPTYKSELSEAEGWI